jgi:hypothetical protein
MSLTEVYRPVKESRWHNTGDCSGKRSVMFLTLRVSSFAFLECFALTEKAAGFLRVWIGQPAIAAVSSVQ